MRFLYILILTQLSIYAQEPPARFIFDPAHLATSISDFSSKYDVSSYIFRREVPNNPMTLVREPYEYDSTVYIPVNTSGIELAQAGDVVLLTIKAKSSQERLDLFVRVEEDMDYSESISIKNLEFRPGTYFYDTCYSKKKYEIRNYLYSERKIDFNSRNSKKISIRKLNKILRKYKDCKTPKI